MPPVEENTMFNIPNLVTIFTILGILVTFISSHLLHIYGQLLVLTYTTTLILMEPHDMGTSTARSCVMTRFEQMPHARGPTLLEILYACLEITGNHNRNHWKSGNQTLRQKSQFLGQFFRNISEILNICEIYVKSLNIFINLIYFL